LQKKGHERERAIRGNKQARDGLLETKANRMKGQAGKRVTREEDKTREIIVRGQVRRMRIINLHQNSSTSGDRPANQNRMQKRQRQRRIG
jgi:hypothetical protein